MQKTQREQSGPLTDAPLSGRQLQAPHFAHGLEADIASYREGAAN